LIADYQRATDRNPRFGRWNGIYHKGVGGRGAPESERDTAPVTAYDSSFGTTYIGNDRTFAGLDIEYCRIELGTPQMEDTARRTDASAGIHYDRAAGAALGQRTKTYVLYGLDTYDLCLYQRRGGKNKTKEQQMYKRFFHYSGRLILIFTIQFLRALTFNDYNL